MQQIDTLMKKNKNLYPRKEVKVLECRLTIQQASDVAKQFVRADRAIQVFVH